MAKISHSDSAPAEKVHYTFANAEFDLSGSSTYETEDASLLASAEAHPYLKVTREPVEVVQGAYRQQLRPEEDHLSGVGGINPNDPDEARKAEEAKRVALDNPVALDAGLTQTKPVEVSGTAVTLAADETSKTHDKTEKGSK